MYTTLSLLLVNSLKAIKRTETRQRSQFCVPLYVISQLQPLGETKAILYVFRYQHQQLRQTLPPAACRSGHYCHGHCYKYEDDRKPTIKNPCFTAGRSRVYV